ncbi:nuclear transport factor 2 family protein [Candidatus Gracilibacteria bacterium]|nr:nuclear transport factor 2 family protein [Candidatus Gracilibacteria bacterium]NJM90029.1 nuclear transport factor 2 family protein [Hydrococcus sp. RU_2_2]NJP18663.1 nuclear transport factor 2 family protein [Hydrococcus sp. CRU_1_1]
MRNFRTLSHSFCSKQARASIAFLLGLGFTIGSAMVSVAESPETAPPELKTSLAQMEMAANQKDIEKVMEFYSSDFKNSDGLNYASLEKAIAQFWQRYDNVQYKTELQSWENTGQELVAETVTTVTGTGKQKKRAIQLKSTIKSRQYFQNQKLVRQEILSEKTEVTSGNKPPVVEIILPETVSVGEEFEFDVVVQEPLGNDLLAGVAIDEKVEGDRYLKPGAVNLELLQAGGLFKRAKAPAQPGNRWLSAILVRGDGMTMVTQRLRVEK